jgi:fibronectin-binding autotransporter adhesin
MVSRIGRISLLGLVALALVPAVPANNIYNSNPDSFFDSGFELFYAGPQWLLNALPGSVSDRVAHARVARVPFDRDGDRVESLYRYSNDVGTLANPFNVGLFNNVVLFATASGWPKTSTPKIADIATTYTYNRTAGNTSGTADQWSAGTNWSAVPVGAVDTTLTFGTGPLAAGTTVFTNNDIAGNFQLNILNFTYAGPSSGAQPTVTISGNPLEFVSNGATAPTVSIAATGTVKPLLTITNNVVLTNNLTVTATSDGIFSGIISGGGSLTKLGGGSLTLSIANTFSGGTFFGNASGTAAGTLALGVSSTGAPGAVTSGPVGTGTFTLRGTGASSTVRSTDATARTINNTIAFAGSNVDIHYGSSTTGDLTFGGTVSLGAAPRTFTVDNANTTFSGIISGASGGVTKAGAGTLILSGANTYGGATAVNAGTLLATGGTVGSVTASATGTGNVTVGGTGTILAGGSTTGTTGTILGSVDYTGSTNAHLSPGTTGDGTTTTAILHTGALTLASSSIFNVNLNTTTAGSGFDQLIASSAINLNSATLTLALGGTFNIGDKFFIMENSSASANGISLFSNGATVTSGTYSFAINYADIANGDAIANDISLTVTAVPEPSTWIGAALALGAIGWTQRKKLRGLLAQRA